MSGIFLAPNEYCCAEDELILKMSIIKCFLASTHRIWNPRNSWLLSLLQKKCSSTRRRGQKKRGRFSQKRRRFARKRRSFFKKRGSFFSEQRRPIPKPRTIEQAECSLPLQYIARITSPLESLARKHESPLKKCFNPLSSRGRAHANHCNLCLFAFTTFTDFRITLCVSSRNKPFSDIF